MLSSGVAHCALWQCPLPPLMLMRMTTYPGVTNNIQARNLKYSAQRDYNYLEREYLSIL